MGQKINANALRMGFGKTWKTKWFSDGSDYTTNVIEDNTLRKAVRKVLRVAGLDRVEISRFPNLIEIAVYVARPGVAIGRNGEGVDLLKKDLKKLIKKEIDIKINEVKRPDISASIIARGIAEGIERRQSPKLLMASFKNKAMAAGAKGVKIWVGGRIGGAAQARVIKAAEGPVPLQTLKAKIDYAEETAKSIEHGLFGIKVWVYNPDVKKLNDSRY